MERTLAIIKPDAIENGFTGSIIDRIEQEGTFFLLLLFLRSRPSVDVFPLCEGFFVLESKVVNLNKSQAKEFYEEHKDKPFFKNLVAFMTR